MVDPTTALSGLRRRDVHVRCICIQSDSEEKLITGLYDTRQRATHRTVSRISGSVAHTPSQVSLHSPRSKSMRHARHGPRSGPSPPAPPTVPAVCAAWYARPAAAPCGAQDTCMRPSSAAIARASLIPGVYLLLLEAVLDQRGLLSLTTLTLSDSAAEGGQLISCRNASCAPCSERSMRLELGAQSLKVQFATPVGSSVTASFSERASRCGRCRCG